MAAPVPVFDARPAVIELPEWEEDRDLLERVRACIEAQTRAGGATLREKFAPDPDAARAVSEEALAEIDRGRHAPSDIVEERSLSNCIAFNFSNVEGAVMDRDVERARRAADAIVARRLCALFRDGDRLWVRNSGHFWYPPGGYMGWHHNLRTPGWRLYVAWAREPGKSFFRYRDPESGRIVTSVDREWTFRLFAIDPARPLWHAIYSDTDRFSLGYRLRPRPSLARRGRARLNRWLAAISGSDRAGGTPA